MPQGDLSIRSPDDPPRSPTPLTIRVAPGEALDVAGSRAWRAWLADEPDVSGHGRSPEAAIGHLVRLQAGRLGVTIEETTGG